MKDNILEDIFTIIGEHEQLKVRSLLPESWDINQRAVERILGLDHAVIELTRLDADCWPAQNDRKAKTIRLSESFLKDQNYTRDEILATILHEVGHLVDPSAEEFPDSAASYVTIMNGEAGAESEFFADRFSADAGFTNSLVSVLNKLINDSRFISDIDLIERRINKLK